MEGRRFPLAKRASRRDSQPAAGPIWCNFADERGGALHVGLLCVGDLFIGTAVLPIDEWRQRRMPVIDEDHAVLLAGDADAGQFVSAVANLFGDSTQAPAADFRDLSSIPL